ncbi:putative protein serine/threonine kinase [Tieghemostelium lacteum]|uniref:non-specific serine/threonine protein kinase n=1 Tax=Tieghemostelium lacteum TaxID=361077 RepID=A0A151Z9I3_TIELA|nr:putative protein serine/threonine kinase [Tieghemostelium lacteum]|eukprot:KYQ90593.1 putative protein serine/threonine kinase [Tieghemostelium lacteum]
MKNIFKKWFQNEAGQQTDSNGEVVTAKDDHEKPGEQGNESHSNNNEQQQQSPKDEQQQPSIRRETNPPPHTPTTVVVEEIKPDTSSVEHQQQPTSNTNTPSSPITTTNTVDNNKTQSSSKDEENNKTTEPSTIETNQEQQQNTKAPNSSTVNLGETLTNTQVQTKDHSNSQSRGGVTSSPSSHSLQSASTPNTPPPPPPQPKEKESLGILGKLKLKLKGGSKEKETVSDKKSLSHKNDGAQVVPHHVPLHQQEEKVEREVIYIKSIEELPDDCQKLMKASGIPEEKFRANLQTLLYVLHFRTGKILKLHEEIPREPRKKFTSDRFSDGETLLEHLDPHVLKKIYKDTDQVGKGGFGTVYFAKSTRDKKTVAIKKMPHQTKRQITQNLREVSILSKCNHPNIVKLITCHIDKEQNLWLVMEFMEGGTFEEAAKAWRFNENNLAYVARELLKGLQYLHENGMVHRDLKSANIMMSVEGKVKLIDFGLCEDVSTGSPCHMVGSPFWMPPEMILQKPHSTPVDIWSFAISLLEMANQRPPMMESAVKAMFTVATEGATGFDHPELWSDVFKDFLSLCLKMEPSERATAVELLQHPFIKKADTRDNMENILKKIFLTNSLMNSGF